MADIIPLKRKQEQKDQQLFCPHCGHCLFKNYGRVEKETTIITGLTCDQCGGRFPKDKAE